MITDDDEEIEVDGINYPVRIVRQLIRGIKGGCPIQCSALSALQSFEHDRREQMELANGVIAEQQRIEQLERKTDD